MLIHSFFVPAFRTKQDVVPGRYSTTWFTATKPGKYHLFCAEYCGTKHSGMTGWIYAMEPQDYQAWLSGGSPSDRWRRTARSCSRTWLAAIATRRMARAAAPAWWDFTAGSVQLADGRSVKADEAYLRESILRPNAKIVAGYQPLMPTFQGQVTEEGVLQLIEYIKSLSPRPATGAGTTPAEINVNPGVATAAPSNP